MKLGEIMYKQNPQANQSSEGAKENANQEKPEDKDKKDDNVVDADFEEVDEESENICIKVLSGSLRPDILNERPSRAGGIVCSSKPVTFFRASSLSSIQASEF